ncbi:MAG: class II aldolase/adducin family protein [Armatimonadota bacterium]
MAQRFHPIGEEIAMEKQPITPPADSLQLRQEIIQACIYLMDIGFCIGTWGNIAVRVEEGLLVTPSRIDFRQMEPDDMVLVSWEGKKIGGYRLPTSESELHRLVLLHRPDMGVSVHSHSPYASAVSAARKSIPVCLEDMSQIIGGEVRCAEYTPAGRHKSLAEAAVAVMGDESAAVLLANHGPIVCGRNIPEALTAAQILEKSAMAFILTASIGGCVPIPSELVREERHRFLYKYGSPDDKPTE